MKKTKKKKLAQKQPRRNSIIRFAVFILSLFISFSAVQANAREMTAYPRVKLQTLDKATARTQTFEARVGSILKFGPLYIKVQSCQKSSPIDNPESAAFVQIWEISKKEEKAEWVFSGWMFASSPALSPVDHPIYDVWLIDCMPEKGQEIVTAPPAPEPEPSEETSPVKAPASENEDTEVAPLD